MGTLANEKRAGERRPERAKATATQVNLSNISVEDQRLSAFAALADLPRWVPYALVWNPQREKYDKVPHDGQHGLSTKNPAHWMTLAEAQECVSQHNDLKGVGLVLSFGSVELNGKTLVGFDYDGVADDFQPLFPGYLEASPSGKGRRAFAWVESAKLDGHADNTKAQPDGCDHCEIYTGTSPRFLTVTFDVVDDSPIPALDVTQTASLLKHLKRADITAPMPPENLEGGKVIDLSRYATTPRQRRLLEGAGQPEIDRSAEVHGLLIKALDSGVPKADLLATLLGHEKLVAYLQDHRQSAGMAVIDFARDEISRACKHSLAGKQEDALSQYESSEPDDFFEYIGAVDAKPIDWLIQDYFEANTFGLIFGQPGTYKTFLALDVAVSIAAASLDPKIDWHGSRIYHPGVVIYLCGEGQANLKRRVAALCRKRGIDVKKLPLLAVKVPQDLSDEQCVAKLKAAIAKLKELPVLIVVDTLARHYGGKDENSNTDGHLEKPRRAHLLLKLHCPEPCRA